MTATSIGYGDVKPVTLSERGACTVLIVVSAFINAYALQMVMTSIADSDKYKKIFQQTIDDLNKMSAKYPYCRPCGWCRRPQNMKSIKV